MMAVFFETASLHRSLTGLKLLMLLTQPPDITGVLHQAWLTV
jgi:hypothetical protein